MSMEEEVVPVHAQKMLLTAGFVAILGMLIQFYRVVWLKPRRVGLELNRQGIKGPHPWFLLGNIPEMIIFEYKLHKPRFQDQDHAHVSHQSWIHSIQPSFQHWTNLFGRTYMFWIGNIPILYASEHSLVKEICVHSSLELGKPVHLKDSFGPLLGEGISTSNGPTWAYQKKIIAPQLYMDKVKGMYNLIVESANELVNLWESKMEKDGGGIVDVRIDEDLKSFSADVISKACFGSNYSKGKQIFLRIRALQQALMNRSNAICIPGFMYVPTENNREIWRLEKEVRSLVLTVVEERKQNKCEIDLLQIIINGAQATELSFMSMENFIMDNCKTMYLAGHETTAITACWTLLLLASNPDWQARVRDEVFQVFVGHVQDTDHVLRKMRLLTMVIYEVLRLYPAITQLLREAFEDIKFGDIQVPKGSQIWIPVLGLHRDPSIWGSDADDFNPERFANGVAGACKIPQLYLPFGAGPRLCPGQHLALTELKIVLSIVVSKFSFSVSPKYHHSPVSKLALEPEFGMNLLIKKI
ncbi:hypothetical protein Dsin_027511 [Dipteronia sinensis]|uniref:Cytochrome P450 n=1 Tax=Dipteronia sinensis TaxID=43782 RepID=A0AAD9ZNW5_9ROSI|nr:hypothetical protein Dsin_027511 [Dipteronia sinensis]